jgi:hypothetical protein
MKRRSEKRCFNSAMSDGKWRVAATHSNLWDGTAAYFLTRIKSRIMSGSMDFPSSSSRLVGHRRYGRVVFIGFWSLCGLTSMRRVGLCANLYGIWARLMRRELYCLDG